MILLCGSIRCRLCRSASRRGGSLTISPTLWTSTIWWARPACISTRKSPTISTLTSSSCSLCHIEGAFSLSFRPSAFSLSFRPSEASGEIYIEPGSGASISFQAATDGAPLGCASLRPLPESTASSLRDNLYLQGPSPCPLRGWICPPCGSLKALHRSATPS